MEPTDQSVGFGGCVVGQKFVGEKNVAWFTSPLPLSVYGEGSSAGGRHYTLAREGAV
jgi:hypothetical protein